ncbi:MAG: hypothetical protein Q9P14_14900, partial [candidate division KSB1 bacterium]|nr:hypothetical protein [candidate division KSB1 bacterium]
VISAYLGRYTDFSKMDIKIWERYFFIFSANCSLDKLASSSPTLYGRPTITVEFLMQWMRAIRDIPNMNIISLKIFFENYNVTIGNRSISSK